MTSSAHTPPAPGRWRGILFPPPNHENRDNPIGSSFALTVIAVLVQGLSRFGYTLLIGNILGNKILGQVNTAISLALFLVLLWPQASGNAASRFIAMARGQADPDQQLSVGLYASRSAAIGMAVLSVTAVVIATFTLNLPLSYALSTGLLVLALSAYNFVRGVRTGNNQFVTTTAWDFISSTVTLTLLVVVLLGGFTPLLLLPLSVGYLIYAIPAWPRTGGSVLPSALKKEILTFTFWASVNIITAAGLLQLSLLFGSHFDTLAAVGQYSAAVAIATPASMLSSSMMVALAPSVARMYTAGDMENMKRQLDSIMRLMVLVFLPVFGVGIIWAEPLIQLLYGARFKEFEGSIPLLILLFFAVSATSFNAANARLNGGEAWGVRALALCNAAGMAGGVALIFWLGPSLGVRASAIGYMVACFISALAPMIIVWIHDRMHWGYVLTRIVCGYALILGCLFIGTHYSSWWVPPALTIGFCALWAALSWKDLAANTRKVTALLRRT